MKAVHPFFPEYEIHDDGRIVRVVPTYHGRCGEVFGRILVSGYRQFKLVGADGERYLVRANRLIAEAFHGPAPSTAHQAAHTDGNKLNNTAVNLRWATPKENMADKIAHGTLAKGSKIGTARLTEQQVAEIRAASTGKRGEAPRLSFKYGVSINTIWRVLRGEYWKHVSGMSALDRMNRAVS